MLFALITIIFLSYVIYILINYDNIAYQIIVWECFLFNFDFYLIAIFTFCVKLFLYLFIKLI